MLIGRSLEMTCSNFAVYFGGFLAIFVRSQREPLTQDIIFSIYQVITFLHTFNFLVVMGITGLGDLNVMLKRFISIF